MPRRLCLSVLGVLACLGVAAADDAAPRVSAWLEPEGAVQVGEPVVLWVQVLVPTWFARAPQYPLSLDVPGALAELTNRSVNASERVGRDTWSGLRKAYQIVPLAAGRYEVPGVSLTLQVADPGKPAREVQVASPPLAFAATVPAEAAGLGYFVPAIAFTLEQQVEGDLHALALGSAITRTLRQSATGTTAALLPPHEPTRPPGLGVYSDPALVTDRPGERGEASVGSRVDRVTYVVEAPGSYSLPAVRIAWWDREQQALRWAEAEGIAFVVSAAVAQAAADDAPPSDAGRAGLLRWLVGGALLLLALAPVVRVGRVRAGAWRARRAASPGAAWRQVLAAAEADDPQATYAALLAWAARVNPGRALADSLARPGVANLRREVEALERRLFGPDAVSTPWQGRELARAARGARPRAAPASRAPALPPLEPPPDRPGPTSGLRAE